MTLVVCSALSAAGLAIAILTAFRRRPRRAVVIAGWSLLPIGFQLTGLLTMLRKIGVAIGHWASGLVLNPTVWTGFAVLALAVVLLVTARLTNGGRRRRKREKRERKEQRAASTAAGPAAPAASSPAGELQGDRTPPQPAATRAKAGKAKPDDDFSEIEDILKRHGI